MAWALGLSQPRRWRFFGCVGPEERSVGALIALQKMGILGDVEILRVEDTVPENKEAENAAIEHNRTRCQAAGLSLDLVNVALDAPLMNATWKQRLSFSKKTSLCLDISSMPKRFFFSVVKTALNSPDVENFIVLYSKPVSYPDGGLSGNPEQWAAMSGFKCDDPDLEKEATAHLIVGAGFAVGGLGGHLEGRNNNGILVDVLIPFPAEPWSSVHRSWTFARELGECLEVNPTKENNEVQLAYHRVGALDTCSAFEILLRRTCEGRSPVALAPLGPKPISLAMCLLASQKDGFPVYYAQPKTYAVEYSRGYKITYAYWIKHNGENLYKIPETSDGLIM